MTKNDVQTILSETAALTTMMRMAAGEKTPAKPTKGSAEQEAALNKLAEQWLTEYLPNLLTKAQPALTALGDLFKPPHSVGELWNAAGRVRELGDVVSAGVTEALAVGAPAIKGLDALALAQVVVRFMLKRSVQPRVPAWVYPMIENAVAGGVALVYEMQVRPKLKGPRD